MARATWVSERSSSADTLQYGRSSTPELVVVITLAATVVLVTVKSLEGGSRDQTACSKQLYRRGDQNRPCHPVDGWDRPCHPVDG